MNKFENLLTSQQMDDFIDLVSDYVDQKWGRTELGLQASSYNIWIIFYSYTITLTKFRNLYIIEIYNSDTKELNRYGAKSFIEILDYTQFMFDYIIGPPMIAV